MPLSSFKALIEQQQIPPPFSRMSEEFCTTYFAATQAEGKDLQKSMIYLEQYLKLIGEQIRHPYPFDVFHKKVTSPFNYHRFGLDLMRQLVLFERSRVEGKQHIEQMVQQVKKGENVILLANHQTEPDPQLINLMLEKDFSSFASEMIFVAGDRVTTDPLAVPLSLGCNILCIYSKRRIEHPPERKAEKQLHNQRAMKKMRELLEEGGKVIYVAPSGGRDRANAQGTVEVAPFDAQSIEMFWLMAQQAKTPTHFYPLTLSTYDILPPPQSIDPTLGEQRRTQCSPIFLSFGKELSMQDFPGADEPDKKLRRQRRAEYIWQLVSKDYARIRGI